MTNNNSGDREDSSDRYTRFFDSIGDRLGETGRRFLGTAVMVGLVGLLALRSPGCSSLPPSHNPLDKYPVQISSQELDPWKRQYLADGKLDSGELEKLAVSFFEDNAYRFAFGDPNYLPREGDLRVVGYNLNGVDGPEATIYWKETGKEYSFRLSKDWKGAGISEKLTE